MKIIKKIFADIRLGLAGILLLSLLTASFKGGNDKAPEEVKVLLITTMGDIKIKLYNETPGHRDNFIKLVKEHTYDSLLFHRVIQSFMVQGGDPESKKAAPGAMLGNGNVGYTLPAEINPKFFHKRGALAAARLGDDINPKKESSGCQFYIVQGRTFTAADLDMFESRQNQQIKQQIFTQYIMKPENEAIKQKFVALQQAGKMDSLQVLSKQIEPQIEAEYAKVPHFTFTPEQRQAYATSGGAPHLDGAYTVFGEVIEGMDVVDKIAAIPVDNMSRPTTDVRILKAKIIK
jgi:cyclophilin family peptidyl-prolyl cis-trans isomerase